MHRISLHTEDGAEWTVAPAAADADTLPAGFDPAPRPAAVPGCVHADLLEAGAIADPFVAEQEKDCQWVGETAWRYRCEFEIDPLALECDHLELALDGVDTVATFTLNGTEVGQTCNMHRRHRLDLKPAAVAGTNALEIIFDVAGDVAAQRRDAYPVDLPAQGNGANPYRPHHFIRKMACSFGWDWGPVLITAGLFRGARVEAWDAARLGDVRTLVVEAAEDAATLKVNADVHGASGVTQLEFELRDPDGAVVFADEAEVVATGGAGGGLDGADVASVEIRLDRPRLWWPFNHGDQPLYTLAVKPKASAGSGLTRKIGVRTAEIRVADDDGMTPYHVDGLEPGSGMVLHVNGRPIWCKGANWIPDDILPSRVTTERYRRRVEQTRNGNMNMLRVWGGGLYEDDRLYEICNELGVLIWQDFLFACAAYPEDDAYAAEIEAEARDNVSRLAGHPSLVVFCGCNENFWAVEEWPYTGPGRNGERFDVEHWADVFDLSSGWGERYYFDILPAAVAAFHPTLPYWPGSPANNNTLDASEDRTHANCENRGDRHIWEVWHGKGQYRNYLSQATRFASEFGYHGPPTWPNITASIETDQFAWDSDQMNWHNKNSDSRPGQELTHKRLADDFVPPTDFDSWLFAAQIMQARALAMGVEWYRALHPYCSGALFWQLNDCWPVSSWSAIDSSENLKPLWYAMRHAMAPRLATIKPQAVTRVGDDDDIADVLKDKPLAVYLHNDTTSSWTGRCVARRVDLAGAVLAEHAADVSVDPLGSQRIELPEKMAAYSGDAALVADVEGDHPTRAWWWFAPDHDTGYGRDFEGSVEATGNETLTVSVRAGDVLRDVCLFADRLDPEAEVDQQCVSALPGETLRFNVTSAALATDPQKLEDALAGTAVLRMANELGRDAVTAR